MSNLAKKTTETKAAESEKKRALLPNAIQLREYAYQTHYVVPPVGTKLTDLQDPNYWCHVAERLRLNDRIEVDAEDGSYYAKFKVVHIERTSAIVALLDFKEIKISPAQMAKQETFSDQFEVVFKGPTAKWCVVRKADKVLLEQGLESKEIANNWVNEYQKAFK